MLELLWLLAGRAWPAPAVLRPIGAVSLLLPFRLSIDPGLLGPRAQPCSSGMLPGNPEELGEQASTDLCNTNAERVKTHRKM